MHIFWIAVLSASGVAGLSASLGAVEPPSGFDGDGFFTSQIQPILQRSCLKCHSSDDDPEGGLALDFRAGWINGGEQGPAVVPGDLKNSPLIQAIRWLDEDTAMPPKKKLSPVEVALLETWVLLGAPDPRELPAKRTD